MCALVVKNEFPRILYMQGPILHVLVKVCVRADKERVQKQPFSSTPLVLYII